MNIELLGRIVNKARRIGVVPLFRYAYKSAGLAPMQIAGRRHGPVIVLNSLPKAGTHLIRRMVEAVPYMRPSYPTIFSGRAEQVPSAVRRIESMSRGQYVSAHMPYDAAIQTALRDLNARHVLLIRDPRDVVISFMKYATSMDPTHWLHAYLRSLPDDESRLAVCIRGVYTDDPSHPLHQPDAAADFNRYARWADEAGVLTLKFEDLIGERGGGDHQRQIDGVDRLLTFIGYPADRARVEEIAANSFGRGSTFNRGKTGSWKSVFTESNKDLFKAVANDCLLKWGYERDDAW